MHIPDSLLQRIEVGHIDYVNEVRCGWDCGVGVSVPLLAWVLSVRMSPCRVCTVLFLGFPSLLEPQPDASASQPSGGASPTAPAGASGGHAGADSAAGAASVQTCIRVVQKHMHKYDGSLLQVRCQLCCPGGVLCGRLAHLPPALQFRCDEKGFLAICAFGLPGRTHEDGPARGVQAALAIVDAAKVSACNNRRG